MDGRVEQFLQSTPIFKKIIGLEHHTPENVGADIDRAVAHETVFHQFMLYTPMPGTPLHAQIAAEGRLLADVDLADTHGQFKFNFQHPAISRDDSKMLLNRAFRLDFERNGPSLFRLMQTMMRRWQRYGPMAIRGCARGSRWRPPSFAPATAPHSGPWSDICGRGIPW